MPVKATVPLFVTTSHPEILIPAPDALIEEPVAPEIAIVPALVADTACVDALEPVSDTP